MKGYNEHSCVHNDIGKKQFLESVAIWILTMVMLVFMFQIVGSATNTENSTPGKVYEFDQKENYEFSSAEEFANAGANNTRKCFGVAGDVVSATERDGVTSYEVGSGKLEFLYQERSLDEIPLTGLPWEVVEDKGKKIDQIKLEDSVLSGAIVIQTSTDRKTWVDAAIMTDVFNDTAESGEVIFSTSDIELINGCYYRVVIAYELRQKTEDSNFLFIETDKYVHKKCAEVYEFYAFIDTGEENITESDQTYSLGQKRRVADFDTYFGEEEIGKKDAHYGWELGNFFVSGYTDEVVDSNQEVVFLKNVGDKVTLWFRLNQDINALNGNESLSITADTEGQDQYFETPLMNFGKGVLIIRYTDHNNVKGDPIIYTNYLEANTMVGAETKVQLFEEGDYEVALDYQITDDQLIDTVGHYQIFFKFSVRNGNCMAYPFDLETGEELSNSSMTENGFRLDLALSRYLKVNIKREVMKDSADGLAEDTRFNGAAKDGAQYTDEGIYTITVKNVYTEQTTTKKIYVGTNDVLRAHMTSGLSIPEINDLLEQGATINSDGIINLSALQTESEEPAEDSTAENTEDAAQSVMADDAIASAEPEEVSAVAVEADEEAKKPGRLGAVVVIAPIVAIITAGIILICRKKGKRNDDEVDRGM